MRSREERFWDYVSLGELGHRTYRRRNRSQDLARIFSAREDHQSAIFIVLDPNNSRRSVDFLRLAPIFTHVLFNAEG